MATRAPTSRRAKLLVFGGLALALATMQGVRLVGAGTETARHADDACLDRRVIGVR